MAGRAQPTAMAPGIVDHLNLKAASIIAGEAALGLLVSIYLSYSRFPNILSSMRNRLIKSR